MPRRALRWVVGVVAGLAVAGAVVLLWHKPATPATPGPADDVLARVGPRQIRVSDFTRAMAWRGGAHPEKLDKQALLDELITREALIARAQQLGLDQDPGFVRDWQNLLISDLRRRELEPRLEKVTVSDAAVEQYYTQNQTRFTQPAKRRLAVIVVATHGKMSDDAFSRCRARIEEVRRKALATELGTTGFGTLAAESSDDQASRYQGGDLGWFDEGRETSTCDKAVVAAGFAIPASGGISNVVTTERGLYLIKLLDKREATVTPLAAVTAQIRQRLLLDKQRQIEQSFQEQLREAAAVKVFRDVLDRVPLPPPSQAEPESPPAPP